MAGLGLVHLGFLAAGAAVGVPILIHLLLRPRARRVEIGSLRFLKLVLRDNTRRRRLRRWLLLVLRCIAVLLLAFLFARPYLRGDLKPDGEREVIVLIDQSASMAANSAEPTRFAEAQDTAEQIIKQQPEGSVVQVAYFDSDGIAPLAEARIDKERQPGFAVTDYQRALQWARDRMFLSTRAHKRLYLLSDMQRSDLAGSWEQRMPADVAVEIVEVGHALVANLGVESIDVEQSVLRTEQPIVLAATVWNAGAMPARNVVVRLVLDGVTGKLEQTVSIAGTTRQVVRFTPPIKKAGVYTGYLEVVPGDGFPLDNRRWLALEVRPPDRLLLVDGEPGRTAYASETYYLETALRLRSPGSKETITPYEPERLVWTESAALPDLTVFRAVLLCNVAELSEADAASLRKFVAGGGSLLVFTGSKVRPEGYAALQHAGLLPATIEGELGPELFRFDKWDRSHPILRPLSDPLQGDLRRITFHHVTRVKPRENAKVLATAPNGEPLLVEGRLEQGITLLLAAPADRDWGDWPQGRLYVPLIHQIVGYLTSRLPENQRVQSVPVGPAAANPPGVTLTNDKYLVRNLDARESETDRFSVKQFREVFHLPEVIGQQEPRVDIPPGSQRPDELWTWVLWGLLVLLIVELFVANRSQG